jgi:quercetin dioxygenase-like cupin family protein
MTGVRRIVTGNDRDGLAIIKSDKVFEPKPVTGGIASFAKLWVTDQSPADNTDETDGADHQRGLTCAGGTVLRVVDFGPGKASPMHKTNSIDYGIVLSGDVEMRLDGGEATRLKPGDIVVQRGTNHAWVNVGESWARMAFVLIEAKPLGDGSGVTP